MADPNGSLFTFTLNSFEIRDTRALHNDTDFVTFTLLVKSADGKGTPRTLTKSMGDVNNGVHQVDLSFKDVRVRPTDTVTLNYLIVNSGYKQPNAVLKKLEQAAEKLATTEATVYGDTIQTGLGSILGPVAGWLVGEILNILLPNCDGPVAAEQDKFTYDDLVTMAGTRPFSQSTEHAGTNSAVGCGGNSKYIVNWGLIEAGVVVQKVAVPDVREFPAVQAQTEIRAAKLIPRLAGQNGTRAWVFSQSPFPGTLVTPQSTVTLTLHTGELP